MVCLPDWKALGEKSLGLQELYKCVGTYLTLDLNRGWRARIPNSFNNRSIDVKSNYVGQVDQ